jgi:hypothetical protein
MSLLSATAETRWRAAGVSGRVHPSTCDHFDHKSVEGGGRFGARIFLVVPIGTIDGGGHRALAVATFSSPPHDGGEAPAKDATASLRCAMRAQ